MRHQHFPGDGPVKEALDPHNDFGKWQAYYGESFEHHLIPFRAAFEAGTGGSMPGYAIQVDYDTVGMNFSAGIADDLLRRKFALQGLVVTDWLRNMPWGVDQIGGDNDLKHILESVNDGSLPVSRLDESARRILKPMFELGLFDNPCVDPERARSIVASKPRMDAGAAAQRKSIVVVKNSKALLPAVGGRNLYVENLNTETAAAYGTVVNDPKQADLAIIAVSAPFEIHKGSPSFFPGAHEGSWPMRARRMPGSSRRSTRWSRPARPAVLAEFIDQVGAILGHFSVSDAALMDVIFGRAAASGKLPLDLPRDMESVRKQKEDVPHDLNNRLFRTGFGLTYPARGR